MRRHALPASKRLGAAAVSALLATAAMLALAAAPANAAKTYAFQGAFGSAAQPTLGKPAGMAVDPATGDLLVIDYNPAFGGSGKLRRFKPNGEPAPFSALGSNLIDGKKGVGAQACGSEPESCDETPGNAGILSSEGFGSPEVQVAVAPPGAAGGTAGDIYVTDAFRGLIDVFDSTGAYLGQKSFGFPCGVAVDPTGNVFVGSYEGPAGVHKLIPTAPATFSAAAGSPFPTSAPCQVAAGAGKTAGFVFAAFYGGEVKKIDSEGAGEGQTKYVVSPGASTTMAVNPGTGRLFVAKGSEVVEYDASGASSTVFSSFKAASSVEGVAVNGETGDAYVTRAGNAKVEIFEAVPIPEVTIGSVSEITGTGARVNAAVNPDGGEITECKFEYGTTTAYGSSAPCVGAIPTDTAKHDVTAALGGLAKNTTYHYRLVAKNSDGQQAASGDRTFVTFGPPMIAEQRPLDVERTKATIRAKINPSGAATTYRFEWGTDTSYGNRIPIDHELFVGSGADPIAVTAHLAGLQPATTYHFRVLATNSFGATAGPDQTFETLNEAGLPNNRGIELVSPADKRPVGTIEELDFSQIYYQATESGDRMGYLILNGAGDSPGGGEVIYAGSRTSEGWSSTEISSPPLIPAPTSTSLVSGVTGLVRYLDPENLKCGLVATHNPLSADTPQADVENGVFNLYRWNASDETYTLITNRIPLNPDAGQRPIGLYTIAGASADCSRIIFYSSAYSFIKGASPLYEWDDGTLRDAARRPGDSPPPAFSKPELERVAEGKNSVSHGGRFFFQAQSNQGADSGKRAIFVRKSPTEILDASQPTHGPTLGAQYEGASPDGSRVFFLANYGIAATSSSGPNENCTSVMIDISSTACDLYSYDVDTGQLKDVSADANPADTKGAVVQGVMAISENGSVVYFAARGQLVPENGRSYAQNLLGEGHANVYRYDADAPPAQALTYVGSLTAGDVSSQALIHSSQLGNNWSSQTNEDGSYLLFASRDDLSVPNPLKTESAYLFSAATGSTVCVSCPADGSAPKFRKDASEGMHAVIRGIRRGGFNVLPRSLSEDGRVVFNSEEVLAPGAIEGHGEVVGTILVRHPTQTNVYEWHRGQVSLLATGAVEALGMGGPNGRDVFIKSFEQLTGQDFDFSGDVYDFRSGGGFADPPDPPPPCDPAADQCQGTPSSPPPGSSSPASSSFTGPGNPPPHQKKKQKKQKKHQKKKQKKHQKKKQKKHDKKNSKRQAKSNRGGAK